MPVVGYHWSGNHHAVVRGINSITAVWSDGDRLYPCDYRLYHKRGDQKTKNDHFADLRTAAHGRGLCPEAVLFDGWYARVENLDQAPLPTSQPANCVTRTHFSGGFVHE
ncbi:Transposase OS=Candidatus Competibacter denitrificans Run_A_D11 GN=BN873_420001 PE=4 SV=1 [Gemmata massiliana]|uniref:Transposase n=1 Tax=Gemmata massiliana TaxID=1210884 RepID=A0A6P2D023_9BACT|nr:hypothetical protein [Gemmata massiliana]VTR94489.1 Transposase OS=Candidatus Competibacter denitrificans Run_A_D11 GN=BN873_420001 PE=4 SV=1 [Gemmata massiliana]